MNSDPHIVKIRPSLILYNSCDNDTFHEASAKSTDQDTKTASLDEFCQRVLEKGEYPRLQVVERNRYLYTINNTRLALFQRLEQSGYCGKVKVEIMPLKTIPPSLRDVLCPQGHTTSKMSYWGKIARGYKLLGPSSSWHDKEDSDNDDEDDEDDAICRAEKALECYRNRYEETALDSSTDDDDDYYDDDDDDDDDNDVDGEDGDQLQDTNVDNETNEEDEQKHQWQTSTESESSGLIEHHAVET